MGGGRRAGNGESERILGQAPAEGQLNQGSQRARARPATWEPWRTLGPVRSNPGADRTELQAVGASRLEAVGEVGGGPNWKPAWQLWSWLSRLADRLPASSTLSQFLTLQKASDPCALRSPGR